METEVKLTKLAQCAGCGAKVGAGTLAKLLDGIPTRSDERLLVGFDKSDDASVYKIDENTALVQTLDFFPPIVDDPEMFGEIAAVNAISDIYAMGADPKLALNIMCVTKDMPKESIQAILRGGYKKAYEAGVIITGGHTIHDQEPKYGLSVSGFVHPQKFLTNSGARPGDILILTKPLGVGILTTSAKAEFIDQKVMDKIYDQMRQLNKYARDIMVKYEVHSCTDVTGFGLLGQGKMMVNPVHMAAIYTAFSNNGNMLKPYLVKENGSKKQVLKETIFTKQAVNTVNEAMRQVIRDPSGTGHAANIEGVDLRGKTGTAEIKQSQTDTKGTEIGWFVTIMPATNNREALELVSMTENVKKRGGSGYVVNKTKKIMEEYLQ